MELLSRLTRLGGKCLRETKRIWASEYGTVPEVVGRRSKKHPLSYGFGPPSRLAANLQHSLPNRFPNLLIFYGVME